jgi:hypothetical protein
MWRGLHCSSAANSSFVNSAAGFTSVRGWIFSFVMGSLFLSAPYYLNFFGDFLLSATASAFADQPAPKPTATRAKAKAVAQRECPLSRSTS